MPQEANMLKVNEHMVERIFRVALGVVLLGIAFTMGQWWGYLGFVPLLTGVTGFCPLYRIFGFQTCSDCEE